MSPTLNGREFPPGAGDPMSNRATGEWFRKKGARSVAQRYERAEPSSVEAHWYWTDTGWRVWADDDVKPAKRPKGR